MRVSIPPLPNTPSWHGTQLKKRSYNFDFTFTVIDEMRVN